MSAGWGVACSSMRALAARMPNRPPIPYITWPHNTEAARFVKPSPHTVDQEPLASCTSRRPCIARSLLVMPPVTRRTWSACLVEGRSIQ